MNSVTSRKKLIKFSKGRQKSDEKSRVGRVTDLLLYLALLNSTHSPRCAFVTHKVVWPNSV